MIAFRAAAAARPGPTTTTIPNQIEENDMRIRNQRQRRALYAGIADRPLPDVDRVVERFDQGWSRGSVTATMGLLHDMHRHLTDPARRPLPGISTVA